VTPEIFLGFRSPVIFGQGSAPVAGCRDPSRFRPRQRFSPQALPSLLARLHLGHRSWQPSSVLRMRVQGSPGRFIPDFGSYNDRGICCVDAGFPNRRCPRGRISMRTAFICVTVTVTSPLERIYISAGVTRRRSAFDRRVGVYQEVGTDRRTFAVISLWGKFGGLHACAATFVYIVPLPNIFLTRLFSKPRLKGKDFEEIARLPWAQEVPSSNLGAPTTYFFIINELSLTLQRWRQTWVQFGPKYKY